MLACILICVATIAVMICAILFFPKIKIGKFALDSYWIVTLVGAIVLMVSGLANIQTIWETLIADTAVNPIKILVLFICMTVLSVYLDELGFFRYLANAVLKRAKSGQKRLFLYLYLTVSVLTIFTSNDIIVLSFTPFICYFCKNAKISPLPYITAEFVAANTWSMALVIGNPTNIYLATAYGLDFLGYLKISFIPTILAGTVAFGMLYLLNRKALNIPMQVTEEKVELGDKLSLWVGIVHLAVCTLLLAIASYLGWQMWLISLCAVVSLFVFSLIICAVKKKKPIHLGKTIQRIPYQLVPFVLSMFVIIVALSQNGVTLAIGNLLGESLPILKYGVASFLTSNIINNIPMSILFSSILETVGESASYPAVFATIIGSNMGALFTPVGALAGIMWSSILNRHGLKFGYKNFLKMGVTIAIPTLITALLGLWLSLTIFA
jgi:arsenical pump membrane protein